MTDTLPPLPPKGYGNDGHSDEAMRAYAGAAVLAEREACARLCDEREHANLYGVRECAVAIRSRK